MVVVAYAKSLVKGYTLQISLLSPLVLTNGALHVRYLSDLLEFELNLFIFVELQLKCKRTYVVSFGWPTPVSVSAE